MLGRFILFVVLFFSITSCTVGPKPIEYGSDGCHFCSMTIVDRQHAAEIVTKKGKAYKFDAVECMMNHLKDIDITTIKLFLVNDYQGPGEWVNAQEATYLITEDIPSPMGEYLSAFSSRKAAELIESENKGQLYSWEELKARFKIE